MAWQKTYGGSSGDYAFSIQQTSDGGYIVAGATSSFGAGSSDLWVLKLNSDGSVAWQKTYGGSNTDSAQSIQQTSDGGYIVAGFTDSFGAGRLDIWVLKLNPDGSVAWQRTYGGSNDDNAQSIQQTSDGGYIVAGRTRSFGAGSWDLWVLKLNSNGSVAWQKTYGGWSFDYAFSIQQTSDGGYIVGGDTYSFGAGRSDLWVLKLNSDGSVAWQKTYGGSNSDSAQSIQQTSDGGYIVGGYAYSFGAGHAAVWVLKINSDGSVAWQKTYGGSAGDFAYSIQQTSDGGYIVAGTIRPSSVVQDDIWVLKLDSDGNISGCPGGLIGTSSASVSETTVTGVPTTVTGANTSASAQPSDVIPAETTISPGVVCTGLVPPAGLQISWATGTIQWDPVPGATGYKIYYGSSSGNYTGVIDVGTATSYSISSLPIGTNYIAVAYIVGALESSKSSEFVVSNAGIPDVEITALVDLYNSTNGSGWIRNDNWLNPAVSQCSWYGVTCAGNQVTQIDLHQNNLVGTIPASIGNLTNLQYLYLPINQLTGSIPAELGKLTNLQYLYLGGNQLSGSIPAELGSLTNLQALDLDGNQLTGNIPPELGSLTNLQALNLWGNQLTGSIPAELGSLTNLRYLHLFSNQFTGNIPPQLGSLTNLQALDLGNNQLTGSIPAGLGSLTNLQTLNLDDNQLAGSIPAELGSLTNLQYLYLRGNQLTGSIPAELGSLTNLRYLNLFSNQFTGNIPPELGSLTNLQTLDLGNNQLTGSIPAEFGSLTNLQYLYLFYNQLTGSIPPQLGSLTNLQTLNLWGNQLTGQIPATLINLTNLIPNQSDLRWNALYTSDNTLRTFVNQKQGGGDWESTQTIAPTNLNVTVLSSTSVQLTWTPIVYTGHTGGYEVWRRASGETLWVLDGVTPDKSANSYTVTNLTPGTSYVFRLRTFTYPHATNQSTVYSEYTLVL